MWKILMHDTKAPFTDLANNFKLHKKESIILVLIYLTNLPDINKQLHDSQRKFKKGTNQVSDKQLLILLFF